MEKLDNQTLFQENCKYCDKKFPATPYEGQAKSWKKVHEKYCKENPSNKRK